MQVIENFPLKNLNTFGVAAHASWYVEIKHEDDLKALFEQDRWKNSPRLVLG